VLVAQTIAVGACVLPASVETSRLGEMRTIAPGSAQGVAVIFSRDHSPETPVGLGRQMVECVTQGIREGRAGVSLVGETELYAVVFPGLRPSEVLLRQDTLKLLLERPDIRERVERLGLRYLVMVGGTRSGGTDAATAPMVGLMAAWTESTNLTATIFDLTSEETPVSVKAGAKGEGGMGVILIVPFYFDRTTVRSPCKALGRETARALGGAPKPDAR